MAPCQRRDRLALWYQGCSEARWTVPSLVDTCIDFILESVLVPPADLRSPQGGVTTTCTWEVRHQKGWARRLPLTLSDRLLREARAKYDNNKGIERLLLVYLCTLESTRHGSLATPVYLYTSSLGRQRLLEALLDTSLIETYKQVDLNMYNFYHRKDFTHCWFEQEPELEAERTKLEAGEAVLVADLLARCYNVVVLSLHTVCDDRMLQIIDQTCPHLAHLDVSFSKNVTDLGVSSLCSRSSVTWCSLRVVELEGTCLSVTGLDQLLAGLPGLTCIEATVIEDYLQALQAALALPLDEEPQLRLAAALRSPEWRGGPLAIQRLSLDRPGPLLDLVVGRLFDRLTSLKLHHVHREEWPRLAQLALLKELRCLSVGGAPLTALVSALVPLGPGLRELRYTCYADQHDGQINFSVIAATCPNLRVLAISGNALVYTPDTNRNCSSMRDLLPALRHVTINVHAYVPQAVWTCLMAGSRQLESLELSKCEELTDSSLLQLLASQPACMTGLKRFCVRGTHRGDVKLTEAALGALRARSSLLDYVGDCYTWDLRMNCCTVDQIRGIL